MTFGSSKQMLLAAEEVEDDCVECITLGSSGEDDIEDGGCGEVARLIGKDWYGVLQPSARSRGSRCTGEDDCLYGSCGEGHLGEADR